MSKLTAHDHWDEVYRSKRENEVSWFEASPDVSLGLIEATGIGKAAPILDVGGGLSRLAEALSEAGYLDVTVLDVSAEAIRRRQARGSPVRGIVADVTKWQPDRTFHIWHDRAALHFLVEE
ncbi:MAG: class I SAM-dependent methyltransferase, partial [Methylobacteriaceae bacterium]|nr:class I SAM-dependent methyltransferase [Methylobacteriaceae bacterium]MBV9244360.1 class I SAM-dependent methyltransferase [Methylobacteriaceae bacterium]